MGASNAEVARRAFAEFGRPLEESEAWDPDVTIVNAAGWVIEAEYHGHEGVRRWWADLDDAFVDFGLELDEVIELDEERVLTTQRMVGHFRATGIPTDAQWASILTVRDGRVVRAEGYLSKRRAMRAAGLSEG
jgi:ketosteroid isomerase-like protein